MVIDLGLWSNSFIIFFSLFPYLSYSNQFIEYFKWFSCNLLNTKELWYASNTPVKLAIEFDVSNVCDCFLLNGALFVTNVWFCWLKKEIFCIVFGKMHKYPYLVDDSVSLLPI